MADKITSFSSVFDTFLSKITDDMYMELSEEETLPLQEELLMSALPHFEFPRKDIFNFDKENQVFNVDLSLEEINIIAVYMMVEWFSIQLASVEMTRMKYSGSDFKFTSQANHISKLSALKRDLEQSVKSKQSMYRRQKIDAFGNVTPDYEGLSTPKYLQDRGEDWWNIHTQNMEKSEQGLLGDI